MAVADAGGFDVVDEKPAYGGEGVLCVAFDEVAGMEDELPGEEEDEAEDEEEEAQA